MKKIKMKSMDKAMIIRFWDENETGAYEDVSTYATVHFYEVDGTVAFIEPFGVMVDDNDKRYRHYYNREKMNENIEILEMFEF